jgi:hypothetical protein
MAIPVIKVHSADGTVQTIDGANPLSVTNVGAAGGVADVNVTDRIGRLLGRTTNYDVLVNGTLGALNATVEIAGEGLGTVGLGISGTWAGTIVAEVEVGDGVWDPIPIIDNTLGSAALSTTGNGNFILGVAGALTVRIRMSLYTSGTATVYMEGTSAAAGVFLSRSIPTGGNLIGSILLAAGASYVGQVGADVLEIVQTPTITAGAYTAGDALGGLLTFAGAAVTSGGKGMITKVVVIDNAKQSAPVDLVLFDQTFTATADNAAFDPSDADLANGLGAISIANTDYDEFTDNCMATKASGQKMPFEYDLAGTSLFGQLVIRNGDTYAAVNDITIKITVRRYG